MKCSVKIEDLKTVNEIENVWSDEDFVELLERMNMEDADKIDSSELKEYLFMAINDLDPDEAAEILLIYKLSGKLSKGQIQTLSHEMLNDKLAEEYSDISLHYPLFNVNQLLYKAYKGKFPNTKASILTLEIDFSKNEKLNLTREIVLKAISNGLTDRNLIKRLFSKQLAGKIEFTEAQHIIWDLKQLENGSLTMITSDYWINEEDFSGFEFEGIIHEFEKEED